MSTGQQAPLSLVLSAAVRLVRLVGWLSRVSGRGRGGTLPGKVLLRLRPTALAELTAGRQVVLVSGTNGKSTTTRLLAAALSSGGTVVSNIQGANLLAGLVTAVLGSAERGAPAVLEVDEIVVPAALAATRAEILVLLNLSRDQLDRVQEVASHVARWSAALRAAPWVHVVANADDPLVVTAVLQGEVSRDRCTWVGAGSPWQRDASLCPRCGRAWDPAAESWHCSGCGLSRPETTWALVADDQMTSPGGELTVLNLALPGRASASDAVMAAAAAHLVHIPVAAATARMRSVQDIDGRYLTVQLDGRSVRLLLAKNPAGWLEVLDQVEHGSEVLLLGVNARIADGTDPSWLWDVPFEQLVGRQVVVFGERALDLSTRLFYAEVVHQVSSDVGAALELAAGQPVVVAANYTAFVQTRAVLRGAAG